MKVQNVGSRIAADSGPQCSVPSATPSVEVQFTASFETQKLQSTMILWATLNIFIVRKTNLQHIQEYIVTCSMSESIVSAKRKSCI